MWLDSRLARPGKVPSACCQRRTLWERRKLPCAAATHPLSSNSPAPTQQCARDRSLHGSPCSARARL
eukprot:15455266-Alexandrium_andersonii.AAC.1